MPPSYTSRHRRPNVLSLLALALLLVGGAGLLRERISPSGDDASPCDPTVADCSSPSAGAASGGAASGRAGGVPFGGATLIPAAEACRDAGYLCTLLDDTGRAFIRHWKGLDGTLVVHVPPPDFEGPTRARQLQRAAAAGIRAWNGQPFPILVDLRGNRNPHFSVRWSRTLSGTSLGRAETRWTATEGLTVTALYLATRSPFNAQAPLTDRQVRLIAAHEMGHALGLPHSDSPRDVMYPTNTAGSLTARDYRTVEALYRLPDGTEIVR
ncbi:MAG: matrixin family metalloprotease [Gemmatimonadota bacterium]